MLVSARLCGDACDAGAAKSPPAERAFYILAIYAGILARSNNAHCPSQLEDMETDLTDGNSSNANRIELQTNSPTGFAKYRITPHANLHAKLAFLAPRSSDESPSTNGRRSDARRSSNRLADP